jgi:hypothetical protein
VRGHEAFGFGIAARPIHLRSRCANWPRIGERCASSLRAPLGMAGLDFLISIDCFSNGALSLFARGTQLPKARFTVKALHGEVAL